MRCYINYTFSILLSFRSPSTGSFGSIRVKNPITSVGCSRDGKESDSALNLTGSPFFFGRGNTLVAFGCNSKASLTNIEPSMVGCELNCTASKVTRYLEKPSLFWTKPGVLTMALHILLALHTVKINNQGEGEGEGEGSCDGNGCCSANLSYKEVYQVVGLRIESFDHRNSASVKCRVAFLTDEDYTISEPQSIFAQGYATITIEWVIQTNTLSFLNSLSCKNTKEYGDLSSHTRHKTSCVCENFTISGTRYANCQCSPCYTGNPYLFNDCKDFNECLRIDSYCERTEICVNKIGHYKCLPDKTVPIMIGIGVGFGSLFLVGGIWLLRKYLKKRKVTQRKKKFFKRNGGLLLQQQLNTREGNVEKTRIFSSRELEKATENFSESRILGQGGQGTVYKGMLVDGRTVAVKKSQVVDEDKLEEFINEIVILSQVNHRHVVKLLGCCLETEVPVLVYEFIPNGNLFQHIHEESDDYTMIWGVRLRIAVDIAGAISYLHSAACSPVYHRDVKSTNIMLDEKYRAKVSDFGTSRSVTVDHTHWTTVISGTVGYVDPEYYGSSQYTDKSDVYSFGVILVELITGEKPVITLPGSQEIRGLADHFRAAMKESKFFDIMDARIRDACKPEQEKGNSEEKEILQTQRRTIVATTTQYKRRILGQGGQGTVYKGMLVDGRTVAVKKSQVVDEDKLEEFINEIVILSQVNHRHVVKLLGCCLETEVPILVYEFIPNGNLFQHIHEESDDYTMIWGVRLRIAVDIAGAISYLHSAACSPVYHRDVKSTNIMLDEKYRANVSDFGTSRSVTVDHTHWTTVISGTVGYVDPEYYSSSQYTDKSDVYSFGVILVEFITGEKPVITLSGSQEIRGLADHFRAAMKENKFFDIMDARIRDACKPEQVMAVANLARRCLNSKGKKRPYMTEVFTELEKISSSPEDILVNTENDDGDDAEEEGMNVIEIANSWTVGVTAPAFKTVASPSSADVNECLRKETKNSFTFGICRESETCVNVVGGFKCVRDKTVPILIGVGAGFGILVLVGGIWMLIKYLKRRKVTQRKKKFFKRNGGLLLQQQLNTREGNIEKTRIFSSTELEKATENFSESRILGQGGQGTVYKGMLVDGQMVAVKKSKVVDVDKLEEFINEVVILSQVNHRHVVKLLGCCLETEVPILVYEFIPNGAISYLHSSAYSPVYHRDVKSTNIMLDEKYRAKISDFGTSRSVTVDHTHWTTVISGTVGYVDPEYYSSSQYTDKSDVYSFGVILVELITGEKPVITLSGSQEIRGLADHFRAAMKENRFFDIMDARIRDACKLEQVMAVANLARRCLNSKGKKRPYMTEVFTELERISPSPENALVKIENEDGYDKEEEGMNMIEIANSWTVGVTAPAFKTVASPSSAGVEPLFPRSTCANLSYKEVYQVVGVGAGFGILVLVGGVWLLIKYLKKRKVTQRKKKFFKRNGGLLLQQQLNTREGNVEKTRIFSSRELEKATENFSESRILGQGGQGTVYKGMLVDGRTVAVKKSQVVDEDKLEEFINEIVILSQVNHRHVVKLLGCCLETEVPVLVYEFIPNGNLFQHIHEESENYTLIWGVRLRIAVDIAGAISYLHSSACSPVYHRDVKSTNIMIDEKYRAKVSDFGTSRSVTVDHTHWTTVISGTVGYVDPEYYGSSQYTDKSDVYSFGVILAEFITGEKPVITLSGSQEIGGLADHFRSAMKENKFFDIMDARIRDACAEQVMAVANLARRCLNSKGKKRPYMKEVFTELERISSSPENALVQIENEDGYDEEEEGMNMIEIADSWTVGVTAPAFSTVASASSADVEPLFPRATW
ncbi:hypothetical protein F2Q70_00040233 [Brassica cretica]|nr:hypothetical protein F2Q70_00040233 [Brassica cretica]